MLLKEATPFEGQHLEAKKIHQDDRDLARVHPEAKKRKPFSQSIREHNAFMKH